MQSEIGQHSLFIRQIIECKKDVYESFTCNNGSIDTLKHAEIESEIEKDKKEKVTNTNATDSPEKLEIFKFFHSGYRFFLSDFLISLPVFNSLKVRSAASAVNSTALSMASCRLMGPLTMVTTELMPIL